MNPLLPQAKGRMHIDSNFVVSAFLLSLIVTVCAADEAPAVDPDSTLATHNKWRVAVSVGRLEWSTQLADSAQAWTNTLGRRGCTLEHSTDNAYGENLYMASALIWSDGKTEVQSITAQHVVNSWGDEIHNYDYPLNRCSDICGHYTQVVWKNTSKVGCGMTVCADKSQIWACHYDPPGNYIGERPY